MPQLKTHRHNGEHMYVSCTHKIHLCSFQCAFKEKQASSVKQMEEEEEK